MAIPPHHRSGAPAPEAAGIACVCGGTGSMAMPCKRLFAAMCQGAGSAATYFGLPDNAVVELGARVQI